MRTSKLLKTTHNVHVVNDLCYQENPTDFFAHKEKFDDYCDDGISGILEDFKLNTNTKEIFHKGNFHKPNRNSRILRNCNGENSGKCN